MNPRLRGEPQKDKRLSHMIVLSAVLHVVAIVALVTTATRSRSGPIRPIAYTVELVNPAALGTHLPPGGGKTASAPEPRAEEKPVASQPQPKPEVKEPPVAKKEEPKTAPPVQPKEVVRLPEKEKPLEKPPVKPEPEKTKPQEKKLETQKAEVKPAPELAKAKPEEKKPDSKKPDMLSPEDRDKQILAAVERIKTQVKDKEKSEPGGKTGGSGPLSKGGDPGEGGGGLVRGLEFIMYTEKVQQHMKKSWIVTEKKPGLVATVSFRIQPDGEVFEVELVKPSGDTAFDQSVVRAVRKANPLPPPPQSYLQEFATQKIEMNFGGEGRVN
ncbi:MAG: cell envelope integrity protein TolA [Deltaproteobacteria bacterium]|nr:cell envelope integrity protein TolA [Deltaproteobacteria bacterium]